MKSEKVIARLEKEKAAIEALLAPLTPEQIGAPSTAEVWSLKDHLAHLAMWMAGMVALLHHQPRRAAMGLTPDMAAVRSDDAINAVIYAQHATKSLAQVRTLFDNTHAQFVEAILQIGDDGLAKSYSHYEPENQTATGKRPVEGWVIGNGAAHYAKHRRWMEETIARNGWSS